MTRGMKNSGIEWVGEIPADWKVEKTSKICNTITDYVASGSFASLAENVKYLDEPDYAMLVRTADVSKKGYTSKPVYVDEHAYNFLKNSNLFGGELLLPNIGGVGEVYIVPKLYDKMTLAPNAIIIRTDYCDKYYYYYFYSDAGFMSIKEISQSTAQPKFNKTDFKQIKVLLPPLTEQKKIADFLDNKVSEIDKMIAETKSSIENYKEYKQSVITEAVTKGLNKNVQMKDSGVEWIGEVPTCWSLYKLKHLASIVRGGSPRPAGDPQYYMGNIPFMKISDITKDENIYVDECVDSIKEAGLSHTRMVKSGTLLLTNSGATLGVPKITTFDTTFNDGIAAFLELKETIDIVFAYYSLKARTKFFLEQASMGMGQPNLNTEIIGNTVVAIPSLEHQKEIVEYLDKVCSEIENLISEKEALIVNLEEYKKSLIYEYVTGKKAVL